MKHTIQIAFRHGFFHSILDSIVCIFTFSKFSHAEIIIDGAWYSSTMKEGVRGTDRATRKGKWTVYYLIINELEYLSLNKHIEESFKYTEYDWLNIMFWLLTKRLIKNDSFYCFEFVYLLLSITRILSVKTLKPTGKTLTKQIRTDLKDRIVKVETIEIK